MRKTEYNLTNVMCHDNGDKSKFKRYFRYDLEVIVYCSVAVAAALTNFEVVACDLFCVGSQGLPNSRLTLIPNDPGDNLSTHKGS